MIQQTSVRPALGRPGLVLAVIVTAQLMLMLDVTVMNVALPRIRTDLGFTPAGLSWVMNAYTLVFGGLLLLGGRAGDLFGRRRVFLAGVAVFTAASLLGALADSAELLVLARVLQGLGAAAAGPNTLALVTTTFTEPSARLRALAVFSGVASAGFAIGLIVGGLLTEWFSWRAVLLINIPFGLAVLALAPRLIPEPARHPARLDLPGALTATAGTSALVYGFIQAAERGWDGPTVLWLVAGGLLLTAFLVLEARTRQPLMPLRLFTDRARAAGYLNFFFGPMAMMSTFFFLTQFLQEVTGLGALGTGFAFLPMAVALFTFSRLVPRWLPVYGPRPLAVAGTALMVIGLGWLTQLTPDSGYFGSLLVPMLLLGIGGGLAFSPLNVVIMSTVPPADAGAAGGVLQTMQQVGAAVGLAVLVTVAGSAARSATGLEALVDGMTTAFTVATLFALLTVAVALTFPQRRAGR
ncbi:MFS transporter [Actinophytocola xanthii]|uniref:MFS transporter n=1 Tax=Actinophytocola xanthii TaxID=1912961 RepID=A0A1Q8CWU2_9PSEU|nr:MFS transporter [Actinophytocola xanthii]OLF18809.1 MFS transporter [Actinophytocola xanthii]